MLPNVGPTPGSHPPTQQAGVTPVAYAQPIPPQTPLTQANFSLVSGFTCGQPGAQETRWERDVSQWITATAGGAITAIQEDPPTEVWLYLDTDGRLIGYSSLSHMPFPDPETGELIGTFYVLPYFGVHSNFRGQRGVPRELRYGRRILGGLIEEVERRGEYPQFLLYVDPANPARQGFYPDFGFVEWDQWIDTADHRTWVRMTRPIPLRTPPASEPRE